MTDHDSLLAAILAHPDEDAPRLMFADWLQEHGDEARAEFIRVQCQIARIPLQELCCWKTSRFVSGASRTALYTPRCRCRICSLRRREYLLGRRHVMWDWCKGIPAGSVNVYRRGFVGKITLSAFQWVMNERAIRSLHPIEHVCLTHLQWDADEDDAWIDRGSAISWVDIYAAATPDEVATDDMLPALLRLRWPGVSVIAL